MRTLKKSLLLYIVITIVLVMICSGVLYAFSGACEVLYSQGPLHNSIRASFYANRLTTGEYSSVPNKHIRRSKVKIDEGGRTTGWVYSGRASSTSDGTLYAAYAFLWDDWNEIAYSYYSWCEYF